MFKVTELSIDEDSFGIPSLDSDAVVLNRAGVIHARGSFTIQENKTTGDVYVIDRYVPYTDYSGGIGFDLYQTKADGGEYLFFNDLLGSVSHAPFKVGIASLGVTDLGAVFGIELTSDEPSRYLIVAFDGCVYVARTKLDVEKLYEDNVFVKSMKKCSSTGQQSSEKTSSALWLHLSSTTMEKDYVLLLHTKQTQASDTDPIYFGNAIDVFYSNRPKSRLVEYHVEDRSNYIDDRGQETYSVNIERSSLVDEDPRFFETEETVVILKIKNRPMPSGPHQSTEWVVSKDPSIFPNQL